MKIWIFCLIIMSALPAFCFQEQIQSKPWFIIFLDIDGVLFRPSQDNLWEKKQEKLRELFGYAKEYSVRERDIATGHLLDVRAVTILENFIDRMSTFHQVGIVLSSAWREGRTFDHLRHHVFAPWGFAQFLIDKTVDGDYYYSTQAEMPSTHSLAKYGFKLRSRADQIDYWLKEHADMNIAHFIIFDDEDDELFKKFPSQFVWTRNYILSEGDILESLARIRHVSPAVQSLALLEEQIKSFLQGIGTSTFTISCLDTPENRAMITKDMTVLYTHFLSSLSEKHLRLFTYYFEQKLQEELERKYFVRLYQENQGVLTTAFRSAGLVPQSDLFPKNSFSCIERKNGLLTVHIHF